MSRFLIWAIIVSMAWMYVSCDEFCEEPNRTAVVINFYAYDTNALLTEQKETIRGIENDSLLYPNSKITKTGHSQVLLPVNPTADIMSFSIKHDTLPTDTVIIRYVRHNGFVSPKCGCVTHAEILGTPESTENSITNIVVTNPNVTTVSYRQGIINAENIRIYY